MMSVPCQRLSLSVSIGVLAIGLSMAVAHQGATGVVKQRMELMKGIGNAMEALSAMYQGEVDYDPATALSHAEVIKEHAPRLLDQFPPGSNEPPSEALNEIWTDWPAFEATALQFGSASDAFVAVLRNGVVMDATLSSFAALGKACSACHQRFRAETES